MTRLTIADIRAARAASAARYRVQAAPAEMSARGFAQVLSGLAPHLPVSEQYEAEEPQQSGRWWSSQREHMVEWFGRHTGYRTHEGADYSARSVYNRLLCPTAFPWIAEALGEDTAVVQAAVDACRAEPNIRKRPRIMRQYLPWERIAALAAQHQ